MDFRRQSVQLSRITRIRLFVFAVSLVSCSEQKTPESAPVGRRGVALHADACSDTDVSTGQLNARPIVESTLDVPSPPMSLQPADLALATDGTLYVVDRTAARVVHLDANGAILREWGRLGDGPGEFREPSTIALGENGSVYVGDRRGRITVFSRTGEIQGTISSQPIRDIADLVVLSNGTLIVAADVRLGEGPRLSEESGAYVALIDSTGSTIKHVLSVSRPEAGVERPLLGHAINRVRLSSGPDDTFAVWYPLDNYVEVFEGTGDELWTMSGCLPETIRSAYARQARGDPGRQSSVPLTLGVDFAADSELRVASFYISADNAKVLRVRRYPKNRGEMAARDFDVSDRPFLYRVVFLSDSTFLTFNATSPDLGIHEFTMR